MELWLKFIELQASNKISPFLFKLAVKRPVLQRYILPTQRLDYLRWYIDNYLHHQEDYREALSQLSCPTLFLLEHNLRFMPQKDNAKSWSRCQMPNRYYFTSLDIRLY